MFCAMIVFYVINTHEVARVPPILNLTLEQAETFMKKTYTPEWFRSGIYPMVKPCVQVKA